MVVLPGVFISPPVLAVRVWPAATRCRRRSDSGPLICPAGKTTAVQEVSSRGPGHVTAAAAERHVGTPGGGAERARGNKRKGKERKGRKQQKSKGKERTKERERKGKDKRKGKERKGKERPKGKERKGKEREKNEK